MDTVTVKTLIDVGKQLISKAFDQSPTTGNGYGYLVAVLVLAVIYSGVREWIERRDARRYRERQDDTLAERWKQENAERKAARADFTKQINTRFDELDGAIHTGIDEIEKEIGAIKTAHAVANERFDGLAREVAEIKRKNP